MQVIETIDDYPDCYNCSYTEAAEEKRFNKDKKELHIIPDYFDCEHNLSFIERFNR